MWVEIDEQVEPGWTAFVTEGIQMKHALLNATGAFADAVQQCRDWGAVLVEIRSAEKQNLVQMYLATAELSLDCMYLL